MQCTSYAKLMQNLCKTYAKLMHLCIASILFIYLFICLFIYMYCTLYIKGEIFRREEKAKTNFVSSAKKK